MCSETLMGTIALGATKTCGSSWASNPLASTRTEYRPGARFANTNQPSWSVLVTAVSRPCWTNVTVAPETEPPTGSSTLPLRVPEDPAFVVARKTNSKETRTANDLAHWCLQTTMSVLLRPRKSGLNVLGGTGLLTHDLLRMGLHLPTLAGSGLLQTERVAYSCGAVADSHRASRSSH